MDDKVDFLILWVDGNDPKWQEDRNKYQCDLQSDGRIQRYRDWENLKYWFRGVEKYAPWVNKIYFVTWGHIPKWLNICHEKIVIVKHDEFMPKEYLPTFNCNPIELNIHRIKELSEKFVYFNDDMFIIDEMEKEDFFKNGLPCDTAALNIHCIDPSINHYAPFQAIGIINKYFNLHHVIKKNWKKWLSLRNGIKLLRTLYLLPSPRFPGMYQTHLPSSFLKSTYEEVWRLEGAVLDETSRNKFRGKLDYTQYVFKEWQLAKGEFYPRTAGIGKNFILDHEKDEKRILEYIKKQKGKMVCVNDGELTVEEFEKYKMDLIEAFEDILPQKSSFEV